MLSHLIDDIKISRVCLLNLSSWHYLLKLHSLVSGGSRIQLRYAGLQFIFIFQESNKRPLVFEVSTHKVCGSPLLNTRALNDGQGWLNRSVMFQLDVATEAILQMLSQAETENTDEEELVCICFPLKVPKSTLEYGAPRPENI